MDKICQQANSMVFRYNRGEELIDTLKDFCQKEKILGGWFFGLGAVSQVELAFYDLTKKKYYGKMIKRSLEVASLTGNIALMNKEVIIHSHGVFSDREAKTVAGHINKLIVAATLEVFFIKLPRIKRHYSQEIGLNLMQK